MRRIATIVVVVVVLALGYVGVGLAFAAQRINAADRTLSSVVAHQNSLNKTLSNVDVTFKTLSSSSTYNPVQAKAAVDQWLAASKAAGTTIDRDDADLAGAANGLKDAPWLTPLSRSNLDRETTRLGHARDALASARSVTAGYLQDGQFWEAFIKSTQDLNAVITAAGGGDWATARSRLAAMRDDVDTALQASGAAGLPPDLHSVMADFQVFVADYGKLIDASQAGDDAGVATATSAVQTDATKIAGYNFDQIILAINAYYKPLIDRFNAQMALATG
jgi:hypothetical protein